MRKPYVREMPVTWWLHKRPYFFFMVRELTAVFIAAYCVVLLFGLSSLKAGPESFGAFLDLLRTSPAIGFHFTALVFAIYHSVTAWNAMPKLVVIRRGEEQLSPLLLVLSNYLVWLLVSLFLCGFVFWSLMIG